MRMAFSNMFRTAAFGSTVNQSTVNQSTTNLFQPPGKGGRSKASRALHTGSNAGQSDQPPFFHCLDDAIAWMTLTRRRPDGPNVGACAEQSCHLN
jgi:hypothetical protein